MTRSPMRLAALALFSAATIPFLTAGPAAAVMVKVGTTFYDVSVIDTSQSANSTLFDPLFAGGSMPWWNDDLLASEFAMKVYDALGGGSDPLYGPLFAYRVDPWVGEVSSMAQLLSDLHVQDGVVTGTGDVVKYAVAKVAPVPLPLPVFGAAAGYGWTRRLRKRLRSGSEG
ncbi:MAG: hypothetical protein ACK41W_11940 [Cyanobacteriota bacterium]|jgi:hypothetical protein